MTADEVYARLTTIFQDVFDDDDIRLKADTTAKDVDGWDSMNHIRLILSVEKEFSARFPASEVANLKNVGEFVDLIMQRA